MITEKDGDIIVSLSVKPRSSKNRLELKGEDLQLKITAPPVEGEANKAVVLFLSKLLSKPQKDIMIEKGLKSKSKIVRITNMNRNDFIKALN
jgi:uncharacterized protein